MNSAISAALLVGCALSSLAEPSPCEGLRLLGWTNGQFYFVLLAEPEVAYSIETSSNLLNWTSAFVSSNSPEARIIQLGATQEAGFYRTIRGPLPLFNGAISAHQGLDLKGNNFFVDSYDSMDPAHSTNGLYDPTTRKAGGDVAVEEGLLDLGNAKINGMLRTGPLVGLSLGPNGFVGDLNWTGPGIQAGWLRSNFKFCFPEVTFPVGFSPLTPSGIGTNLYVLGSADYLLPALELRANEHVLVAGNARLFVQGNISMIGLTSIDIRPGASLRLYVGGGMASLTAVNTQGNANGFRYYGLPANTNVSWSGNAQFLGSIYAPQATLLIGGGGSTVYHFSGACVANRISFNGHFAFHFDEALRRRGPMR